ncbi:MAG: hypothetical protein RL682_1455 [Pseudomonadota bacterium]
MAKKTETTEAAVLRLDALKHLGQGAVTASYDADLPEVVRMLNLALATELVCVLRYRRHHFMARGIHARIVATEFLAHSSEELGHADSFGCTHRAVGRRA